jgi:hypothetical protein
MTCLQHLAAGPGRVTDRQQLWRRDGGKSQPTPRESIGISQVFRLL